jgi:hypothetical protein
LAIDFKYFAVSSMSENEPCKEKPKRRRLNADEFVRKAEAKLVEAKAVKQKERLREVKDVADGAGVEFQPREWTIHDEKIVYLPTGKAFLSAHEAVEYLENEGTEGAWAHLLAALMTKLNEHRAKADLVNESAWKLGWFEGKIIYQYMDGHFPTFLTETEAVDFAVQGYTSMDEEIAREISSVLQECDNLLLRVSALFANAMSDLLSLESMVPIKEEDCMKELQLGITSGDGSDDEDDDDDEDYSDAESESELDEELVQ